MDLPLPTSQGTSKTDPLALLKPGKPGANGGDAFARHLDEARQPTDTRNAHGERRAERRDDSREEPSEARRDEETAGRDEIDRPEEDDRTADKADRSADDGDVAENAESGAGKTAAANTEPALFEQPTDAAGDMADTAEDAEDDPADGQPQPDTEQLADAAGAEQAADVSEETETPQDETDSGESTDQVDTAPTGLEIAQAANATVQSRTDGAQAAANPTRAAQSPLSAPVGEPGAESAAPQTKPGTSPGTVDGDTAEAGEDGDAIPRTPVAGKSGKGLGHDAAAKLAQRENTAATPNDRPSPNVNANASSSRNAAPRPAPAAQLLAALGSGLAPDAGQMAPDGLPPVNGTTGLSSAQQSGPQNSNPVMVRFGALPGQAQATQVPVTSIAAQVSRHAQNGINRFEIQIDPPELGRIDVAMEIGKDGRVTAHMTVDRPETLDMLQRDARALEKALQDAGLDADDDTLEFSLRDEGANPEHANASLESRDGSRSADGAPDEDEPDETSPATPVTLTADGRVDIRV